MREQRYGDSVYGYLIDVGSKAFGWEFLRRNPNYRADHRSIASENDAVLVARRWGCAADPGLRADQLTAISPSRQSH
jgi:Proteobacterial transcriptional regulator-like domain